MLEVPVVHVVIGEVHVDVVEGAFGFTMLELLSVVLELGPLTGGKGGPVV